ncbi:MAG: serpin family protein [Candidatus Diapherotrites archaeon]|nr:serpin family protein [Candidatus Diapherotrites archaeon]
MAEKQITMPELKPQQKEVSATFVPLPIVHAVQGADEVLGQGRIWNPVNTFQKWFLENLFKQCLGDVSRLSEKEIKRKVSKAAGELNRFLADNGFNIKLEAFPGDGFGVVSILVIKVKWLEAGKLASIISGNRNFEGVYLKSGVEILQAENYPNPIAQITTQSGDVVYMSVADKPRGGFELLEFSNCFEGSLRSAQGYEGVKFPMIDLNQEVDISWLVGMNTVDKEKKGWFISQAKQQTKFRMNEKGAIAESAAAVGMLRMCASFEKPLLIDKPFFVAITRPGCAKPLFVGYCSWDVWKNPGHLDLD